MPPSWEPITPYPYPLSLIPIPFPFVCCVCERVRNIRGAFLSHVAMNTIRRDKIARIIESICASTGSVHYSDLVRALPDMSPTYAMIWLRALCRGEYYRGTCTCPEEEEKAEVAH